MTLNLAHGRAGSWARFIQSAPRARANLSRVARALERERPDVVALQEVDNNSAWNGRFDHGTYLARDARYPHHVGGRHHVNGLLDYGTALLSKLSLRSTATFAFDRPIARPGKGFVVSTVGWPDAPHVEVDLVSLHLDFLSARKHRRELQELVTALSPRSRPRIVMGDFNAGRGAEALAEVAAALDLHTYEPDKLHVTFPALGRRLDWVLVSRDFEFARHQVLAESLSDHQAVIAELSLRRSSSIATAAGRASRLG